MEYDHIHVINTGYTKLDYGFIILASLSEL